MHLYVWNDRFLYVGPSKATSLHRNHAAVWLNASEGKMQVTLADGTALTNSVVYLPSGTEYATAEAAAPIAALFWEPESAGFLRVAEKFPDHARAFACPHADPQSWVMLGNRDTTLAEAEKLISRIFGFDISSSNAAGSMDSRISAALTFLRESPHQYDSIESLADKVHLSPSRLAHLFKGEVGVPIRRYVLWMKMRRALDLAIAGDSLTTAALSAGFADSAHLSRTVRSMMGIAPEFLFRHRERLVIHI
ncbi:MAG: helix-turn-helix domain-containing protein [Betaproteobacteria bacterium]|nr:helix-turn-helix domain-containing protein [Betaproteobacteria bacterium]